MDTSFPKNHKEGEYFLYIYKYKSAFHIRVAQDLRSIEDNYWRSFHRRAFCAEECAELGLNHEFLVKYFNATGGYFSARMGINQNKPMRSDPSDCLTEEQKEHIVRVRGYRLKEAKELKHRTWSDLAVLRKRARAVLPSEIPTLVSLYDKELYK